MVVVVVMVVMVVLSDEDLPEMIDGILLQGVWFLLRLRTVASLLRSHHPTTLFRSLQREKRLLKIIPKMTIPPLLFCLTDYFYNGVFILRQLTDIVKRCGIFQMNQVSVKTKKKQVEKMLTGQTGVPIG